MFTVERIFDFNPQIMWDVLSKAEWIQKWWGPHDFKATINKNDFKVGGTFHWGMEGKGFPQSWNTGRFTEIVPNEKISLKMSFADPSGKAIPASSLGLPGKWPDEIDVTLTLQEIGGKTKVTLTERGIPPEMAEFAKLGWVQQFEKIESLVK